MIVKICANTRSEDLIAADNAGADILGVVVEVAVSKRSVDRHLAHDLFEVPTRADKALLLCDCPLEDAFDILKLIKPYAVHLTGTEPPETVREIRKRFRVKVFKSIHLPPVGQDAPRADNLLEKIKSYKESGVHLIVLDTADPSRKMFGGTGKCSDWDAAAAIVRESRLPVLFAGGISPENVCEAIKRVRPYGVDLVSGVEREVRIKDPAKMRLLVSLVRKCAHEL